MVAMVATAFTTVSARRGFGSTPHPKSQDVVPTNTSPPKTNTVFSPQIRDYVQRCFASENAIASVSADDMQARLKLIINDAASRGALDSTDWVSMALPQDMISRERSSSRAAFESLTSANASDPHLIQGVSSTTNKPNPKKRKSTEFVADDRISSEESNPPWRNVNLRNVFEDRITYSKPGQSPRAEKKLRKTGNKMALQDSSKSGVAELERRRHRFGLDSSDSITTGFMENGLNEAAKRGPVVGLCQTLEKRYFRLTSAPKPETVRPQPILEKTLDLLKSKWKTEYNYSYICDQFKSMRQDLTVQHIRNAFTVNVYETHAHIALQKGDLGEYNQCQTQLRALYKQGLGGRPAEFLAYRILYFVYTGNRTDMNDLLAEIKPADRDVPAVKHALNVRSALALGNFHRFFRLYLEAPNMGPYLMDMFIGRERLHALANICKSYKPNVSLRFITEELAFGDDRECAGFICDNGADFLLEAKPEGPVFLCGKAGQHFDVARAAAFRIVDIKGQI